MTDYYAEKLSAERLRRCYEVAPPRVRQYLHAEIEHSRTKIRPGDRVLELGCGYGRVMSAVAADAGRIVCKDGFTAVTFSPEDFRILASSFGVAAKIYEIDGSSLFCEMRRQ